MYIDQTQQWPAGKRIDILYLPPALTGRLRRGRRRVTQTAAHRADKLQNMLPFVAQFYVRRDANEREPICHVWIYVQSLSKTSSENVVHFGKSVVGESEDDRRGEMEHAARERERRIDQVRIGR